MASDPKWVNIQHIRGLRAPARAEGLRQHVRYEAYGPGAAVVLIDCLTDDRDRTRTEVRRTLARHGGFLGAQGSVAYLFNRVGVLRYRGAAEPEVLTRAALSAGAEDAIVSAGAIEVLTDPEECQAVRARLVRRGWAPVSAEVTERAALAAPMSGETARRMLRLLGALTNLDDVWNVYSNVEISDEVLARI